MNLRTLLISSRCVPLLAGSLAAFGCSSETPLVPELPLSSEGGVWPALESNPNPTVGAGKNPWLEDEFAAGGADSSMSESRDDSDKIDPRESEHGTTPTSPGPEEDVPIRARPMAQFTRYKEGKGSDKRLHLRQLGSEAIEHCRLEIYANGGEKVWRSMILPTPWEPGAEFVICTASESFPECNVELSGSGYNGNDALVLRCDAAPPKSGIVVDVFGRVGEDPGVAWFEPLAPEITSKDAELVRCPGSTIKTEYDPFAAFLIGESWVRLNTGESHEKALQRCPVTLNLGGAGGGL